MLNPDLKTYEEETLKHCGVPPRYLGHSFDNFRVNDKTARAVDVAREWAALKDPKDRGFALIGSPGVGKTHLVVAAMRHVIGLWAPEHVNESSASEYYDPRMFFERKMRFVNVPILMDYMRESLKYNDHDAQSKWNYLLDSASVVVLDDFGKERATDWVTERLYVLIETRYQNLLPVVITSNRTLDDLDDLGYGAAVSRLQETGRVVRIDASDQRPEIGSKKR